MWKLTLHGSVLVLELIAGVDVFAEHVIHLRLLLHRREHARADRRQRRHDARARDRHVLVELVVERPQRLALQRHQALQRGDVLLDVVVVKELFDVRREHGHYLLQRAHAAVVVGRRERHVVVVERREEVDNVDFEAISALHQTDRLLDDEDGSGVLFHLLIHSTHHVVALGHGGVGGEHLLKCC